jgi:ATP-dependent Clp protease, protease subunit
MATTPVPANAPASTLPSEVYAIYCGDINQANGAKTVNSLTIAMGGKVKHVHLLFQSAGGYVGDGVFLYNLFRAVPIELTLYNGGQVSSAGAIAYLGAKRRKTTANASFMLHRSTNSPQFATATKLNHVAKSLVLDDQRTETIARKHINFPPELWIALEHHDVYVSGEEAVKFGIAHEIGEFSPPAGTQVFNLLA